MNTVEIVERSTDARPTFSRVLTFPIRPGKVEAWRRFCQELAGPRRKPFAISRWRLGITRERMALVDSAHGAVSTTTFESHDVALALSRMITSDLPFERWYRDRLEELHGVTLATYGGLPLEPAAQTQELVFEWTGDEETA